MDYDQYLHWDEYYLFQEALGEVVDIQSITRDSSDENDSQLTSASHQTPMGSSRTCREQLEAHHRSRKCQE